jgi:hypothetical protein
VRGNPPALRRGSRSKLGGSANASGVAPYKVVGLGLIAARYFMILCRSLTLDTESKLSARLRRCPPWAGDPLTIKDSHFRHKRLSTWSITLLQSHAHTGEFFSFRTCDPSMRND